MKIKNIHIKKYLVIVAIFITLNTFSTPAEALDPTQNALTAVQTVKQVLSGVQDGIKMAKTVVSTAKNAAAMVKTLKNFDISTFAQNLSGSAMLQIGDTVTASLGIKRDNYTNVFTNGSQVVTDLGGFLKSNAENSVRSVLNQQETLSGSNPYISLGIKSVVLKYRGKANDQIIVRLPFIAQKEICNSKKFKDVIKNGEPKTWINPKPALKNVNIDQLCNANLSAQNPEKSGNDDPDGIALWPTPVKIGAPSNVATGLNKFLISKGYLSGNPNSRFDSNTEQAVRSFQRDQGLDETGEVDNLTKDAMFANQVTQKPISGKTAQAAFIAIAKAGYGGILTNTALADPLNTPAGVLGTIESKLNDKTNETLSNATNQYLSNEGVVGNQICLDANGKPKKFDATDSNKAFCDNLATSATGSAAVVKANLAAARQSPYFDILAKASAAAKKCGADKVGGTADSPKTTFIDKLIKSFLSFNIFTVHRALAVDPPESEDGGSSGSSSGGTGGFGKIADCVDDVGAAANSFMDIANSIIGMGNGGSVDHNTISNNTYAQLATSLEKISNTGLSMSNLSLGANQADKDYIFGTNATATIEQLKIVSGYYADARKINTEKLNTQVYTFVLLEGALIYSGQAVGDFKNNFTTVATKNTVLNFFSGGLNGIFGGNKKKRAAMRDSMNVQAASNGLHTAFINIGKDTRTLIAQMADNNYKEQQVNKLIKMFEDSDARPEDNAAVIAQALKGTITDEEVGKLAIDWNYNSEYVSSLTMPSIDNLSTSLLIPQRAEMYPPFSQFALTTVRLRAYQLARRYYASAPCLSISMNAFQSAGGAVLFKAMCPGASSTRSLLDGFGITSVARFLPDLPRSNYKNKIDPEISRTYSELAFCDKIGIEICDKTKLNILNSALTNGVFNLNNDPAITAYNKTVADICKAPETEINTYCGTTDGINNDYCKNTASTTQLIDEFVTQNCDDGN